MSRAVKLIASLLPQTEAAWDAAQGKLAYDERKPAPHLVGGSGIAHIERPYANPWYYVKRPPNTDPLMFAAPCLCSVPGNVVGVALRPYTFAKERLMMAQCGYCHRIYWSEADG